MKKVFEFRRNDSRTGRRLHVAVELKDGCFSACCAGPAIYWGQCLDRAGKELNIKDPVFLEIVKYWHKWHLNGLQAGTVAQTKLVKEYTKNNPYDYEKVCQYLDSKGLLFDGDYKYGSAWLIHQIDKEDLEAIEKLLAD
jgi:hypothetical protein